MTDTWQDVPRAVPASAQPTDDGWQDVPAAAPEPATGQQGISDRLSRGFMATNNPLAIYAAGKLPQIGGDTAEFFHQGVSQAADAVMGNGPSQLDDIRPEVEKQLISIGRTPEAAKQETDALMRSWRRQERMGGAIMGPMTALTAPLLGAYRSLISRPLEEVGGPPKEVTELAGMVAGAVAGMPAMSREMARVRVTPDGKVSAQRIGELPKQEDFKTAANLMVDESRPTQPGDAVGFKSAIRSTDIPVSADTSLKWNVKQEWLDVVHDGKSIGRVIATPLDDGVLRLGPKLDEEVQRQGIGTAVYDKLDEIGQQYGLHVEPSYNLSPKAFDFWRNRDPSALRNAYAKNDDAIGRLTQEQKDWLTKPAPDPAVTEQNLRTLWDERGIHPAEALNEAKSDAFLKHELTQPPIEVLHASPFSFETFDIGKINTGEGEQSYGHGVYFSSPEALGVHENYLKGFTGREVGGKAFDINDSEHIASVARATETTKEDAITFLEKKKTEQYDKAAEKPYEDAIALIKNDAPLPVVSPSVSYRVKIHASESDLLHLDQTLGQQSTRVQEALKSFGLEEGNRYGDKIPVKYLTGRDIYEQLSSRFGGDAQASEALQQAGIPGAKYHDEGSRHLPIEFNSLTDAENKYVYGKIERAPDVLYEQEIAEPAMAWKKNLIYTRGLKEHNERIVGLIDRILKSGDTAPIEPNRTHNYVVYDDAIAQITHRNGEPFYDQRFKQAVDARDARIIQGLEEAPPIQEPAAPHPDRSLGEALRAADELRAANRDLPSEDRAILGELISAVRSAAAKRQLSIDDGVVQQGDRFKKAPLATDANLADALQKSKRTVMGESVIDPHAEEILGRKADLGKIEQALTDAGIFNLKPLSGGFSSVVLDAGTKVVRLSRGELRHIPDIPEYVKPIAEQKIGGVSVEVLPKLETKGITAADVQRMKETLEKRGLKWGDAAEDNLGRGPDGSLYIIDGHVTRSDGSKIPSATAPDLKEYRPSSTDAIAEHAWVEADQDLARAQAAMARIEEVKARHPEFAPTIDRAVQAVEDTLAQRDAMRPGEPRSLGAGVPPLEGEVYDAIRAAYQKIQSTQTHEWVSLTKLRKELSDFGRGEVDAALQKLSRAQEAHLVPDSNQKTLTATDRAQAIKLGGEEKHLIAMYGRLSSLGADAPMTSLTVQPPPPAGALMASAQEGIKTLFDIGRDIQMKVAPMATGTRDSILAAKDFANTMRKNRWEWARIHDYLTKTFSPEQWKRMWDAADEESIARQLGEKVPPPSEGMTRLYRAEAPGQGGRNFTSDPSQAEVFSRMRPDAQIYYVDVPNEVAKTLPKDPHTFYVVTPEIAAAKKPFQTGASEHMGLATLEPAERAIVEGLHARAQNAWLRARDIGLVEGEGLPAYTPRMVINAAAAVAEQGALPLNSMGTNLRASTARLMKRKYLTAEETEAAAKAKYGEEAELARDIRTLPLAIAQLEDAIAGRTLVNEIKRAGKAGGSETVVEGAVPAGSDQKWFTIDHPALKTWRPKFEEIDGKLQTVKDADGNVIFEQVPIYIRGDFEGPLRAVLDTKSGAAYQAMMSLKGKTMSVIMYSPAIHNLVEFGRAFPAMPTRIFKAYFDGNRAKNDVAIMTEAIDSGLVPIGKRFFNQDIDAIMESPDLTPGRSWTAKVLAAVPGLFDEGAGTAVKRAVDKAGDFWHNTLLWDRIGDLQMGLYTNLRGDLIAKGVDAKTSSIVAAHWANRYAGALPQEAMSSAARKSANMLLFSRSFTMGNLGVMKDMLTGLPKDALAMIEREGGFKEGSINSEIPQLGDFSKGMARRKAMMVVALDIALMYVGNSVLQSTFNVMLGDKTLDEETHGYTRRMKETLNQVETHPLSLLQPFSLAERLSATGENEPGRRDRIRIGYQSDGTAIYARNPVGKIGEEFIGYMSNPLEMLRKKEGTVARPLLQIFQNDKGFGRKVYDPNAETPMDKAAAIWAMVEHFAKAQTPEGQINALSDLVKDEGDPKTSALQTAGPFVGVTFSKGAPGGPATGELYDYRQRHDVKVNMALPDIRKQILRGDVGGALQKMRELDIPPGLQRFYIRTTLDPSTRVGGRTLRDFYMGATPEQRDRLERARQ